MLSRDKKTVRSELLTERKKMLKPCFRSARSSNPTCLQRDANIAMLKPFSLDPLADVGNETPGADDLSVRVFDQPARQGNGHWLPIVFQILLLKSHIRDRKGHRNKRGFRLMPFLRSELLVGQLSQFFESIARHLLISRIRFKDLSLAIRKHNCKGNLFAQRQVTFLQLRRIGRTKEFGLNGHHLHHQVAAYGCFDSLIFMLTARAARNRQQQHADC